MPMNLTSLFRRRRRLRLALACARWLERADGAAMVEFALILPVMMIFLYGGYQVTQALLVYRKLSDTTVEMSSILSEYPQVSATEVQSIMAASSQVMYPQSSANLKVVTSLVNVDTNGNPTVAWSQGYNGGACIPNGTAYTLPTNFNSPGAAYIVVNTSYQYTPVLALPYTPTFAPMVHTIYMVPRNSSTITCPSCTC